MESKWGALASSTPKVSVGVDPVECVGSQGTASSLGVVGEVRIATPYGRALSGHIVGECRAPPIT